MSKRRTLPDDPQPEHLQREHPADRGSVSRAAAQISAAFVGELQALAATLRTTLCEVDLQWLAAQLDQWRGLARARRLQFVVDLKNAYEGIAENQPELPWLAEQLDEWRQRKLQELQGYLADPTFPADDPLRCPISLFGTMDYGRLETAHTRTLAWLLDPDKEHGFGTRLLETVLQAVSPGNDHGTCEVERVTAEFHVPGRRDDESGRLDIVAQGRWTKPPGQQLHWLLAIEAKIDAEEGENQLSFYDDWLESRRAQKVQVFPIFLTPLGRRPESENPNCKPLSFLELACIFRSVLPQLHDKPGYHFLRFYLTGILRDICGWTIPITDVGSCANDPYGYVEYFKAVHRSSEKGAAHGETR